jgi:hypothetical protein
VQKPNILLKLAAVVSAVLLVGGFVGYSAGAFGWLLGNTREKYMGGSKSKAIYIPDSPKQPSSGDAQVDPTLIYSSKSGRIFLPANPQQPPSGTPKKEPTFMGGSKSISITPLIPPPASTQPATAPPAPSPSAKSPE